MKFSQAPLLQRIVALIVFFAIIAGTYWLAKWGVSFLSDNAAIVLYVVVMSIAGFVLLRERRKRLLGEQRRHGSPNRSVGE